MTVLGAMTVSPGVRLVPLLIAAGAGLTAAAEAQELPLDATYGRGAGCAIVAAHGKAAIKAAGKTEDFPESSRAWNVDVVATPDFLAGFDWLCEAGTIDGMYAALQCVTAGATWMPMPIAKFDRAGDSVILTLGDDPPVRLQRCQNRDRKAGVAGTDR